MVLPESAEDLIDVSDFNEDERLPYWAELWPSARALARHLLDEAAPEGRAIELGCGVALPSLALCWRDVPVIASDYYEEALGFARLNAERNGIRSPETLLLDWRTRPEGLGRFELVIAADVVYERRNAEALAGLLPALVAPGGRVLIADPGRVYFPDLRAAMAALGWSVREVEVREEPSPVGEGSPIRVSIVELRPPG
jgi:predicted nicotinamide N-methyase